MARFLLIADHQMQLASNLQYVTVPAGTEIDLDQYSSACTLAMQPLDDAAHALSLVELARVRQGQGWGDIRTAGGVINVPDGLFLPGIGSFYNPSL